VRSQKNGKNWGAPQIEAIAQNCKKRYANFLIFTAGNPPEGQQ
jgi:hypothetical protein